MFALPQDLLLQPLLETEAGFVTQGGSQSQQDVCGGGGDATVLPLTCVQGGLGLSVGAGHSKGATHAQFPKSNGSAD